MPTSETIAQRLAAALRPHADAADLPASIARVSAKRSTIYRALRGTHEPSLSTIAEVARALGVYVVVSPDGSVLALEGTKSVTSIVRKAGG